jgi:hypothetical protein
MAADTNKRCAHPSCTCPAAVDSKYCSTECAAMSKLRTSIAGADMRVATVRRISPIRNNV